MFRWFLWTPAANLRVSTLTVDYRKGIREGVQHLAPFELTHRKIAFVSGPLFSNCHAS